MKRIGINVDLELYYNVNYRLVKFFNEEVRIKEFRKYKVIEIKVDVFSKKIRSKLIYDWKNW